MMIDVGGSSDNSVHGQDAFGFYTDWRTGRVCSIVADGLSEYSESLRVADLVVRKCLAEFNRNIPFNWLTFVDRLRTVVLPSIVDGGLPGATTLTICVADAIENDEYVLRFLALGDSPILQAHHGPLSSDLPGTFLCKRIYGRPIQMSSSATVYSWIDNQSGVCGRIYEGSFKVAPGEIVLVCSDGIRPENSLLVDFGDPELTHRFFSEVSMLGCAVATRNAIDAIRAAHLLSDDATLIAMYFRKPRRSRSQQRLQSRGKVKSIAK